MRQDFRAVDICSDVEYRKIRMMGNSKMCSLWLACLDCLTC